MKTQSTLGKLMLQAGYGLLLVASTVTWAQDTAWHVSTADIRFEMSIASQPSIAEAGIIAILPDGGLLPGSKFKIQVIDAFGNPLQSQALWHNPHEGLALVFEPSTAPTVFIYISRAIEDLKLGPDKIGQTFRPSLLLYVRNGNPSLAQARALAKKPPAGNDIYFAVVDRIFHSALPVGRDEYSSAYYMGWFKAPRPGQTYFYTISQDGSEFAIDGQMIHSWPGRHERHAGQYGERGNWVNLSAGSHKVEYFHFFMTGTWRESQLGWQLPGEGPRELPAGPVQHKLNARPLEPEDFVHSGATTLIKAQSTRGPLAIFQADWESYISPDKDPIYLCRFHPVGQETHPAATTYRWIFNAQQALTTPAPAWLFAGQGDQKVALIVSSGQSTSQCARVIFPKNQDPPQEISWLTVERGATRLAYSQVFLSMCQAVTNQEHSPCADWSTALWQGLLAVADSPLKLPLLTDIFERSRPDILKQPNSLRWPLEQLFYDALCQADPPAALQWLERFIKEERDPKRSEAWQAARIELWLYELDDLEQARKAAQQFMTAGASGGASILALIRMGDVEYFSGNLEEARRLYALAQESKDDPAPALPNIASARPAPSSSGRTPASSLRQPPAAASNVWKIAAVQEAAFYATVQSLLHQKALTEAQETLQRWEREHPLTKLAGDFPLAQARYYMAQQAYRRAEKILRNYRERVHLTNYLPEAMQLEFKCLALLGHNAEALELAQLIIERLPYHPLAEKAKIQLLPENRQHLTLGGEEEAEVTDWTAETHINSERLADLFKTKLRYIDFTQEEEDTLDDEMWEADYP